MNPGRFSIASLFTRAGKALALGGLSLGLIFVLAWNVFSDRPLQPWSFISVPDLAGTGDLPALSVAMQTDPALKAKAAALAEKDENWIFTHYRETDTEISAILLMWAKADMTSAAKTREGLDVRIDTFLRKVYGFGPDDYIVGDPVMGDKPWVRWFNHYKPRFLIQTAAQRVYDGDVIYDLKTDKMSIEGGLSRRFLAGFEEFVRQQPQPDPIINNLLSFIDSTKGLKNLSDADKERVQELMELRQKP